MEKKLVQREPILVANNISRSFGGLLAVDHVNFKVGEGQIAGIIGPNGAGKTTFFNILSGILKPSQGQVSFAGENVTNYLPHQLARIGMARTFQNIRLFGALSALKNVEIARTMHRRESLVASVLGLASAKKEARHHRDAAYHFLELVGLASKGDRLAKDMPYGDQRRLEIARALALGPKIILLDEPAAGLNLREKSELTVLINRIRSELKISLVLIEHHVPMVMELSDQILVLNFGREIASGPPAEIKSHPAVVEAYLGRRGKK